MIGVIVAMKSEMRHLIKEIKLTVKHKIDGIDFYLGTIFCKDVVLAVSGVGKVNAARCTTIMGLAFNVKSIINIGFAGAVGFPVGSVVFITQFRLLDVDTSALGDKAGLFFGTNETTLKPDIKAFQKLNYCLFTGCCFTSDRFINTKIRNILTKNYVVDMECGAIAHVCYFNKIKFIAIKIVSDNLNVKHYKEFNKKENRKKFSEIIKECIK